ncbi:MAG: hypothetical protein IK066_11105 [Kiritimatiellae bacterium]|nr:hypothetical protein [Kiritimatiellia bacterium]
MEPWKPDYPDPKDRRVQMVEAGDLQTYVSDMRPVVSLSGKKADQPACFWTDREHIYLRLDWALWHPVDASNLQFTAALCGAYYCRILLATDNGVKEMVAPVFHVAELPPELFARREKTSAADGDPDTVRPPDDSDTDSEESPFFRKRKAIFALSQSIPDDVDAMSFQHVNLDGLPVDLVVSSDDKAVIFAVFPENDDLVACPPGAETEFPMPSAIPVKRLDQLVRQRETLAKLEPNAQSLLAIIAGEATLESMRTFWAAELAEREIELVEYPGYEDFLRRHFPSLDDDDGEDGDDEE